MNRTIPRLLAAASAVALLAAGAAGCGSDDDGGSGPAASGSASRFDLSGREFTVGSKEFTEQLVLGQITIKTLEAAGAKVKDQTGLEGSVAARKALTSGETDLYWDYTGTAWVNYLGHDRGVPDEQRQFDQLAREDASRSKVAWIDRAPANNTYAFAVRSDAGSAVDDVTTLSELAELARSDPELATLCVGEEFATRSDGLRGVERTYGFSFPDKQVSLVGDAVVYDQVAKGDRCNFGSVFATDGRIEAQNLRVLRDDRKFFPFFNLALSVRQPVLDANPELERLFAPVAEALTDEAAAKLNARVDVDGETPEDVADDFLQEQGIVG